MTNGNITNKTAVSQTNTVEATQGLQLTPKDIISIVRRHILLLCILPIIGTFIGVALYYVLARYAPKYTAVAGITVLEPRLSDPMNIDTATTNKDSYYQFRQTKASFIKQQDMLQDLLTIDKVRATSWFQQYVAPDGSIDVAEAVDTLKSDVGVNVDRDTYIIRLSFSCKSKRESALILNQLVDLYLKSQLERETQTQRERLAQANEEERKIRAEIRAADASLRDIRQSNPTLAEFTTSDNDNNTRHSVKVRHDALEIQVMDLEGQISQIEAQIETLRSRAQGEFDDVVREQIEQDPIAIAARQRILAIRPELARLTAKLGENHRSVRKMREQLRESEAELTARHNFIAELNRRSELQSAQDARVYLVSQLENFRAQLQEALLKQKELDELKSEYNSFVEIRDKGLERLETITTHIQSLNMIVRDPKVSRLERIGPALEPLEMSFPNLKLFAPAGFMLGFIAAAGIAFLIELANTKLRTPMDIKRLTRLPLLGVIYNADEDEDLDEIDLKKIIVEAPYSITSEAFRQLKTNMLLSGTLSESGQSNSLLVTSGQPNEGKTTIATNLAISLAAEQHKVLLIDTNFRRPAIADIFNIGVSLTSTADASNAVSEETDGNTSERSIGLSSILLEQADMSQAVKKTEIRYLDVLDCGIMPSMPSELIAGKSMKAFIETAKQHYDYVIIDSPPLIMSEAKNLAGIVDSTLLVFNALKTKKEDAVLAINELALVKANVSGCVLDSFKRLKGDSSGNILKVYQSYRDTMPSPQAS
ncbi:MAG: polysaccharide biosynthesis tyrosine autokinase [Sedimentisphaeraceae bacterium JB056]